MYNYLYSYIYFIYSYQATAIAAVAPSKKLQGGGLSRELSYIVFPDHWLPFFPFRFSACILPDCFVPCAYE